MPGRLFALFIALSMLLPLPLKAEEQQADDFVRAYLLTIGPGEEAYSLYGHTAIRLECPTKDLDYCFTFEMALTAEEMFKFFVSTAKAGFMVAATPLFLSNYQHEGRSVAEQQLNLTPKEEQQLWRLLDEEIAAGAHWDYSFLTTNCSSMCVWIIERALRSEGEQIAYGELPPAVNGTYGDLLDHIAADAPWHRLFWYLRMGTKSSERGAIADKLAPALLAEAWDKAAIVDSAGHRRPVFAKPQRQLAPQTLTPTACWLTPTVALLLIIITITILTIIIKKRKTMKKIFTSLRSKRLLLSAAVTMLSAASALAGGTDWYAYKVQASAYPTGAGVVYVNTEAVSEEDIKWVESTEYEFTTSNSFGYGYAKANEGWTLLGFTKDTLDADGVLQPVNEVAYTISDETGYASLTFDNGVTSKHFNPETGAEESDDSMTVAALMPLDPNNGFRALFTRVAAKVNPMQTAMGTVEVDKLLNNIGDHVTLTATASNDFCTFQNWTLNDEVVSTEPTLTVDVKEAATYVANFTDSRSVTLHFPAEGGYLPFYSNYSYDLHYLLDSYSPFLYYSYENDQLVDSLNEAGVRVSHLNLSPSGYMYAGKKGALLYGMGDVTISPTDGDEADDDESYSCGLFRWSGDNGVDVATLEQGVDSLDLKYFYYTFNQEKMVFNRITSGTIAPKSIYMRLFGSMVAPGLEAPEVIYFDADGFTTGISSVVSRQQTNGKTYDLQGRPVSTVNRQGIFITDGKKVIKN